MSFPECSLFGCRHHVNLSITHNSLWFLARVYGERKRNFGGLHFRARGYFVSTVGRDEAAIREYIRNQEKEDQRQDPMNHWR